VKAGWTTARLDELCSFQNGLWKGKKPPFVHAGVLRNTNFGPNGVLKMEPSAIAQLDVEQRQFEKRSLETGDIILEKSGGGPKQAVGRVAFFPGADSAYSFSNFTTRCRVADRTRLEPVFLHKFLHHCYISGQTEAMQSHSTGIRNLKLDQYKTLEVPLPPLDEQRRIVATLDAISAQVAAAKENRESKALALKAVRSALLQQLCMEPHPGAAVSKARAAWPLMSFGEMGKWGGGGTPSKSRSDYWLDGVIPWVTPKDMKASVLSGTRDLITAAASEESPARLRPANSVAVVVRSGILRHTFPVAVVPFEAAFNQDMKVLTTSEAVDHRWVAYQLTACGDRILETCRKKGMTVESIDSDSLMKFSIPTPPLDEQQRIVANLDEATAAIDSLESGVDSAAQELDALTASILSNLLAAGS